MTHKKKQQCVVIVVYFIHVLLPKTSLQFTQIHSVYLVWDLAFLTVKWYETGVL